MALRDAATRLWIGFLGNNDSQNRHKRYFNGKVYGTTKNDYWTD